MIYIDCTLEIYRDIMTIISRRSYLSPCHTANQKMKEIYIYILYVINNVFTIYKKNYIVQRPKDVYGVFSASCVTLHVHNNYKSQYIGSHFSHTTMFFTGYFWTVFYYVRRVILINRIR